MPTSNAPTTPGVPVELVRALIAAEERKSDAATALADQPYSTARNKAFAKADDAYEAARAAVEAAIKEIEG